RQRGSRSPAGSAQARSRRSVAVLGFKNLSGRADSAWISTALAEILTTELALGGELRTIPGERIARTKNDLSLRESDGFERDTLARLRRTLAAAYVVLGSSLPVGQGELRVDIRLQDTAAGETILSSGDSGSESDLPALVGRVGERLRRKLNAGAVPVGDT